MIVVSDTSPITNLAAIGQLNLLQQLYGQIVIPQAVYDEMVAVDPPVPGAIEVKTWDWIQTQGVTEPERAIEIRANENAIDRGEAEAIVLAQELGADLLLMDERRGRSLATRYGLNVVGLLGALLQAKQRGLIGAVKPLMDQLIEVAAFRVSGPLYAAVLEMA
ncbi:MAG: DUF3368 domain-containing protein [Spirulina sp. SIO3F2]|nr:DUF3368 domain-containing protein [Spirulina sp. SIO3F2]